mgnify:CR=1 FL=1
MSNKDLEQEFQERLKKELRKHRLKQKLSQKAVADALMVSEATYYRWEKYGQCLTDIFSLLNVFRVLDFSTVEIIDLLGLAPLTLGEIEAVYQDEDILKSIKGNAIYSAMREKCPDIDGFYLRKLLVLLSEENFKRPERK